MVVTDVAILRIGRQVGTGEKESAECGVEDVEVPSGSTRVAAGRSSHDHVSWQALREPSN